MSTSQINARDWIFQVQDSDSTWLDIAGLLTFGLKRSQNEETADTTLFSSDGMYEGQIMQRGAALDASGRYMLDSGTGDLDTGQARIETLAGEVGSDSLGSIRFRHTDQTEWTVWTCAISLGTDVGGGNNDKTAWGFTATRSGAATTADVS